MPARTPWSLAAAYRASLTPAHCLSLSGVVVLLCLQVGGGLGRGVLLARCARVTCDVCRVTCVACMPFNIQHAFNMHSLWQPRAPVSPCVPTARLSRAHPTQPQPPPLPLRRPRAGAGPAHQPAVRPDQDWRVKEPGAMWSGALRRKWKSDSNRHAARHTSIGSTAEDAVNPIDVYCEL
jgi:hypothetical protein